MTRVSNRFQLYLSVCLVSIMAISTGSAVQAATLYGVTGDGAAVDRTLYTIDKTNASKVLVGKFVSPHADGDTGGSEDDGETIGADGNGNLYHMSGLRTHQRQTDHREVFEQVFQDAALKNIPFKDSDLSDADPANWVIGSSVNKTEEALAMVWNPVKFSFLLASLRTQSDTDPNAQPGDGDEPLSALTLDGEVTHLGAWPDDSNGTDVRIKGMAFVDQTLYGVSTKSSLLYELDPTNANIISEMALIPPRGSVLDKFTGMAADPADGTLYAVARINGNEDDRALVTIDSVTGNVAVIGGLGDRFASIAFAKDELPKIPEPSSLVLAACALLGLVLNQRRRES